MKKGLIFGIKTIFIANIINLAFNLLTNFLLPKYLPTAAYAEIKTYQLYVTYCGVLHLGFIDGMYLKFGGKKLSQISMSDLKNNIVTLRIFQVIITVILILFGLYIGDKVFLAFAMSAFPLNMISYFKSLYQASGEFNRYGRILNITTIFTFAINIVLLFIFYVKGSLLYLVAYVILDIIIWIILEGSFNKNHKNHSIKGGFSLSEFLENIKLGFFLMCGNFSSIILTTMDRFFVKITMNTIAFAQYSFAVSIENFLNVAITPITVTLYNYLCKHDKKEDLTKIRIYILIFSVILVSAAFPAKFILEHYLNNYMPASTIIFLLFGAQIFNINIKSIYVNLYKSKRLQTKYFKKLATIIVVGFILNCILWYIMRIKDAFAIGTLLSSILWYFISALDFKEYGEIKKNAFYILFSLLLFLLTGYFLNSITGFICYILSIIILTYIFFKVECNEVIKKMS